MNVTVDWNNAPEGDIRYHETFNSWLVKKTNGIWYTRLNTGEHYKGVSQIHARVHWEEATPRPEQDLTTLDVPFGELDRDTQLRLVNHVLDGGDVNLRAVDGDWITVPFIKGDVIFVSHHKYRAVAKKPEQPTERETLEAKLHEQWVELNATMKRITEIN